MADRYWVGGSATWDATAGTKWATTSGGAGGAAVPGSTDNVYFDTASGAVTVVMNVAATIQKFSCTTGSGGVFSGTLTHNSGITITINTSGTDALTLSSTTTYTPGATTALFTFTHTTGTANIVSNGKRFAAITMNGVGGTLSPSDALRVDAVSNAILTVTNGVFDANNQTMTVGIFSSNNSNTRTITMGSGTWNVGALTSNGQTIWTTATVTGLTFNKNTANIVIPQGSSNAGKTFNTFASQVFNNLTMDPGAIRTNLLLSGTTNTFGTLTIGAGQNVFFAGGSTTTVSNLVVNGSVSLPCLVTSNSPNATATVSCAGTVTVTWACVSWLTGTGGASFTASNSFDGGAITGWTIATPIADLWSTALPGSYAAGTAGYILGTNLDATVSSRASPTNITAGIITTVTNLTNNNDKTGYTLSNTGIDNILDRADAVETGLTPRQSLKLISAATGGKASVSGTTNTFRNAVADSKNRIIATTDSVGQRTAITYDFT